MPKGKRKVVAKPKSDAIPLSVMAPTEEKITEDNVNMIQSQELKPEPMKVEPRIDDVQAIVDEPDFDVQDALSNDVVVDEEPDYKEDPSVLMTADARKIKKLWGEEKQVQTFIPQEPSERGTVYETVSVNGYTVMVKKNTYVTVPQSVHNILAEAYKITASAGRGKKVNRDQAHIDALT